MQMADKGEKTEIVSRNEMGGYTEFVTADVPFLVETRHAGVDILRDLDTRQVIGYRVYDIDEGWVPSPSTSTGESDWRDKLSVHVVEDDEDTVRLSVLGHKIAAWSAYGAEGIALLKLRAMLAASPPPVAEEGLREALTMARAYVAQAVQDDGGIDNCEIGDRLALERIDRALAASPSSPAVKQLEWRQLTSPREDGPADLIAEWEADCVIGTYIIKDDGGEWWLHLADLFDTRQVGRSDDPDRLRGVAQSDYETRIKSSLVSEAGL